MHGKTKMNRKRCKNPIGTFATHSLNSPDDNNNNDKTASAEAYSYNYPTNSSCVNWNQYYTNCTQLGGNPFQGTISFDNIGMAWVAIFLVISLEGWTDIM